MRRLFETVNAPIAAVDMYFCRIWPAFELFGSYLIKTLFFAVQTR
jgi:hypothetical protein